MVGSLAERLLGMRQGLGPLVLSGALKALRTALTRIYFLTAPSRGALPQFRARFRHRSRSVHVGRDDLAVCTRARLYPNATIWLYYWIYGREIALSTTPQKRALKNYRKRLNQRGLARFEVLGLDGDRDLIRSLAKRLAGSDPDSARIRATVRRTISAEPPKKGGVLSALRRSPLVGADLDLKRPVTLGREVDL